MPPNRDNQPFATAISRWFFAVLILFMLYTGYRLVEPYLIPIFLAVVLVVVAGPLYDLVKRLLGGRQKLASALTTLVLLFVIALPLFFIIGMITAQALDLYNTVSAQLNSDGLQRTFDKGLGRLSPYLEQIQETLGISRDEILKQTGELVRQISQMLYSNLTGLVKGFTNVIISSALVLFVTFYLFTDGSSMAAKALSLSPLPEDTNRRIKHDMLISLRATMRGTLVLALLHGTAAGLGFGVFGVPLAVFWGSVMVLSSVVPLVGTALVWVPAGIYLLVTGHTGPAIGMMLWCLTAALVLDNVVRPRLIGKASNLHPLLTFFSVLGGLSVFGVVGLIIGPLVLAVLLSLIGIYERYFLNGNNQDLSEPEPEPAAKGDKK